MSQRSGPDRGSSRRVLSPEPLHIECQYRGAIGIHRCIRAHRGTEISFRLQNTGKRDQSRPALSMHIPAILITEESSPPLNSEVTPGVSTTRASTAFKRSSRSASGYPQGGEESALDGSSVPSKLRCEFLIHPPTATSPLPGKSLCETFPRCEGTAHTGCRSLRALADSIGTRHQTLEEDPVDPAQTKTGIRLPNRKTVETPYGLDRKTDADDGCPKLPE